MYFRYLSNLVTEQIWHKGWCMTCCKAYKEPETWPMDIYKNQTSMVQASNLATLTCSGGERAKRDSAWFLEEMVLPWECNPVHGGRL